MGRSSSGGRTSYRTAASSKPPQKTKNAPPPATANSGGSFLGNIVSNIVEGFGFSTGYSIAQRAVDAGFGYRTYRVETVDSRAVSAASMGGSDASCNVHSKAFQDCLNGYGSDISKCQFYMDLLAECKRNSGSVMTS